MNKLRRITALVLCLLMSAALPLSLTGCSGSADIAADDLMDGVAPRDVSTAPPDGQFSAGAAEFAVGLLKQCMSADNMLISPTSVMLALAMTANGASGETLEQLETALGMDIGSLNAYLAEYSAGLDSSGSLKSANSIWFLDDLDKVTVDGNFLQTNADYFGADVYKAPFDEQTVKDINTWVSDRTDKMVEDILDNISDEAIMYLVNALAFDAEWEKTYTTNDLYDGKFFPLSGGETSAKMMSSKESLYLSDNGAAGFVKPYKDGRFSFAALLPDSGVSLEEYVGSLTGERLLSIIRNAEETTVYTAMPKFSFGYSVELSDALKALGVTTAFSDQADFSRMATVTDGYICIGRVLHKTYISVDELGTKAGAATVVEMVNETAMMDTKYVTLDRPFLFAIIDNETSLPVFLGTVTGL